MDRNWINSSSLSDEYKKGVADFLEFAKRNVVDSSGRYFCSCVKCVNGRQHEVEVIREHLLCDGFLPYYTIWTWHGELLERSTVSQTNLDDVDMDNRLEDMIREVDQESFQRARMYDNLHNDAETPLYTGCTSFTRLSAVLKLVNLKARNGWSDKSFTELLKLLNTMLPEGNTLPNRNYDVKKILCPMGMEYKKIHVCPNDCILYKKEFEALHKCPRCGVSRYKVKDNDCSSDDITKEGPPVKVLWYLPIIPRLKRLFANADDAKNLRWHADGRKCDGQVRHPADSVQWKKIDNEFTQFGKESRNLRLGLATDGMNPYCNPMARVQ